MLDGERIALQSLSLDGVALQASQYDAGPHALTIPHVPQRPFTLEIVTTCNPSANTELSGLYVSGSGASGGLADPQSCPSPQGGEEN